MVRILVDALSTNHGGGQTYLRELLPRLAQRPVDLHLLVSPKVLKAFGRHLPSGVHVHVSPRLGSNPFTRHLYQRYGLPTLIKALSPDVVFVPGGLSGLIRPAQSSFRLVTAIQNMLPFEPAERKRYGRAAYPLTRFRHWLLSGAMIRFLKRVDRAIYISQYSAREVGRHAPATAHRVIPHGIPGGAADLIRGRQAVLSQYGIAKPYVLYVSLFEPYKHQDIVIRGFEHFMASRADSNMELVLAGRATGSYGRKVLALAKSARCAVRCLGEVPPEDLACLRAEAEALLFNSTCECCPFILLEYLSAAKPIITSNKPPMPELVGDAGLCIPPMDPAAWSGALREIFEKPALATQLAERSKERAGRFNWDTATAETYEALAVW